MQPTKQQMIDKIYECIADKTLSFGCKILQCNRISTITSVSDDEEYVFVQSYMVWSELFWQNDEWYEVFWYKNLGFEVVENIWIDEIIWHPVMIGDVLEYSRWDVRDILQKKHNDIHSLYIEIMKKRSNKRKPIDDQSDECITFIYNLLPQWS